VCGADAVRATRMIYPSFLEMRRSGNRRCVVVFSSFALRDHGPQGFSYMGHFQVHHPDVDFIFVKDAANQWYNRGLHGLGANLPQNIERLRELTAGYDHLTAFGSSMGAYAGILYGNMLHAQHVVALSPQTLLRPPFPRFSSRIHRGEYADLNEQPFQGRAQIDIFVGEDDLFDVYQAARLKTAWGDAVHLTIVPNVAHNVVKLFDDTGKFRHMLRHICTGVDVDPLAKFKAEYAEVSVVSSMLQEESFVQLLMQAVETFYRDRPAAQGMFEALLEHVPEWTGAKAKLGMVQYACGRLTDAMVTFAQVAESSTTIDEFYEDYAAAAVHSGEPDRAVKIAAACVEIEPNKKGVLISTATLLEAMGCTEHAQDCRDRWGRVEVTSATGLASTEKYEPPGILRRLLRLRMKP
jgi:hypothetical protein